MSILLLLPTFHPNPSYKVLATLTMLCQVKDGLLICLGWRTSPSEKYLALRTLKQSVFLQLIRHHTCLPSKATLKRRRTLNPSPPIPLRKHMQSHKSICQLLFYSVPPPHPTKHGLKLL
ncbi:hypothetical protein ES288_A08G113800v1 [Gossypium darwinii]|uniref:Uncharacterized protein n=1 Tax=Gossypium darwinii TaxID=34276 RepID=A0A5D2FI45_GOSDA|nr:hypothetical protein ES288_A08G113800v1 [Gossypium darwinii]